MKSTFWLIANWKMNVSFDRACDFFTKYQTFLEQLTNSKTQIVFCPSFTAISMLAQKLQNSSVLIGGQNCSEHQEGNFTGEISAKDLKEAGASLCLIGHAERRLLHHETNAIVMHKIARAIENSLLPIICVGEKEFSSTFDTTKKYIAAQLKPIFDVLQNYPSCPSILIAYEPVWAIGSNNPPSEHHLHKTFEWLTEVISASGIQVPVSLIYGGSVSSETLEPLLKIPHLDGLLIGGASTHFGSLEKIIRLSNREDS